MAGQITKRLKQWGLRLLFLVIAVFAALLFYYTTTTPTNDGPWKKEYEKLASVSFDGDVATINNFRRARYDDKGYVDAVQWDQRSVNLSDLQEVWFGISVFQKPGIAHTFLSFDFGDEDPVVISIEARQRPDQSYSPLDGALDNYHLIYTIADERDIIGVRTHRREDRVYFQPLTMDKERITRLFVDMTTRANYLVENPEFYNTLSSNCTNSILRDTDVPKLQRYVDPRIILPGYSDRIAYSYGVIDTRYAREDLREASYLDPQTFALEGPDFSKKIRDNFYDKLAKKTPLD